MIPFAYYNEIDPYAAQWLRNLIARGLIAPGEVDERSITEVHADDLKGFSQCHFFAGIGGWSIALRQAGWDDYRPVWTGSCPCQPFSIAGSKNTFRDERHLWPAWFSLIGKLHPPTIFGEQVEAAVRWGWLDLVFTDLEKKSYACGAAVLPACGVGAPHIRQRLWFVADANGGHSSAERQQRGGQHGQRQEDSGPGGASLMADASHPDRRPGERAAQAGTGQDGEGGWGSAGGSIDGDMADTASRGQREFRHEARPGSGRHADGGFIAGDMGHAYVTGLEGRSDQSGERAGQRTIGAPGASFWSDAEWIPCTDGKARPIEPGSFPLAHGVQRRTSKLRAYGNAIVPQVAAEFIKAAIS